MILAINTETFLGINYDEAVSIIKSLGGNVKMLVTSPREEESIKSGGGEPKPALQPRREEPASKPSKVVDKPKAEPAAAAADKKKEEKPKPQEDDSKVELTKDASGLGLTIVGGSDTPLVMNKLMRNVVFNHSFLARLECSYMRYIPGDLQTSQEN